jgi:glutathione synthase/RimK-type ligase-like ATP-grasp enzyme
MDWGTRVILLWGPANDPPLISVRRALARLAAPVMVLDQERVFETSIDLTVDCELHGVLKVAEMEVALEDIGAVYMRPQPIRRIAPRCESTLACWTELTPALVVNRFSTIGSNGSKPLQLSLIRESGFDVPETLVTTDKAAALAFWKRHGQVIYKSVSGVRSIVGRLTLAHLERVDDLANCPTQFQQYVDGMDVRVHVIGDEVFGCEIESASDDYRYAKPGDSPVRLRAYTVPPQLAGMCRSLAASLDLAVAGIDLRLRSDGRWCCFEVNSAPAFTFFETSARQEMADALARLLAAHRR